MTLFVGMQYLTAKSIIKCIIKLHSLKSINHASILSEIYIHLQKKKKNIPHIAIIQRSPIRLKSSPFQQLYLHSPSTRINSKYRSFESVVHLFPHLSFRNGVPFPTGMEITTFSPFANNARPPAAQRAREA